MILSEVKLVDPVDRKPTEMEWRFTETDRRAIAVFTQSGRIVPKPKFPRANGIVPETMIDQWKML